METRAHFVLIGAFTLAVIAGAFLFVLWFSGLTRISEHKSYEVLFAGSVSGLSRGGSVLFDGLRVGEVTDIAVDPTDPRRVRVLVDIAGSAPIKKDTEARLETQGLTGGAAIELSGGAPDAPPLLGENGRPPMIVAEPSPLQNIMESVQNLSARAESVLAKADRLISDNGAAVDDAVKNVDAFSKALSENSSGVNSALAGLSDLGRKIGPLADRLQVVSDDVDKLVVAVDPEKVRRVVTNIDAFAGALADKKASIDSLLSDSAELAKRLNGTSTKLDSAVADFDSLVKSVDTQKVAGFLDGADALGQTLRDNKGEIERMLKDASALAAKLNQSADKIDPLLASLQGLVGSAEVKGPLGEVSDAARSVRQLANDLNARTKEIAVGLTRFSSTGLREYEALAVDGRRTINDLDRVLRGFERNPSEVIFGAKPALPEFHGGP
jgi:phospholipid/cholesterol/gamma-HCH transport system substrate-binding protein